MAHYGQTVSTKWLLMTDYKYLPEHYQIPPLPIPPFTPKSDSASQMARQYDRPS